MNVVNNLKARWAEYQPNKKSLYKAVGFTALWTMVLGFTVGGWTTQSSAQEMAQQAQVNFAASLCAERFLAADVTGQKLQKLEKVVGRHQRRHALETDGDWLLVPVGTTREFAKATALACADRLHEAAVGTLEQDGRTA